MSRRHRRTLAVAWALGLVGVVAAGGPYGSAADALEAGVEERSQ